jgi:hypothetical protein
MYIYSGTCSGVCHNCTEYIHTYVYIHEKKLYTYSEVKAVNKFGSIYIYMYIYTHIFIHIYTYIYTYIRKKHMYRNEHTRMQCLSMSPRMCLLCMCILVHTYMYACIDMHTYMNTKNRT